MRREQRFKVQVRALRDEDFDGRMEEDHRVQETSSRRRVVVLLRKLVVRSVRVASSQDVASEESDGGLQAAVQNDDEMKFCDEGLVFMIHDIEETEPVGHDIQHDKHRSG